MKYNQNTVPTVTKVTTHQGGVGFSQKPEIEFIGMLATGMQDTFYEKESEREKRFIQVLNEVAKKRVA